MQDAVDAVLVLEYRLGRGGGRLDHSFVSNYDAKTIKEVLNCCVVSLHICKLSRADLHIVAAKFHLIKAECWKML